MSALIIGGDNLRTILYKLRQKGFTNIEHISGRKGWDKKISILLKVEKADLVIVLVDYINHCIVKNTKEKIKTSKSKAIFSKRSWVQLETHINSFIEMQKSA